MIEVIDGALGTLLPARGFDHAEWASVRALADAPNVVEAIHREYAAAGATVLTANTFLAHPYFLGRAGVTERAEDLVVRAVTLARRAGSETRGIKVAASFAPLPSDRGLRWSSQAAAATGAGVDILMPETITGLEAALESVEACAGLGPELWLSVVVGPEARLLDGSPLMTLIAALRERTDDVDAVLLNCTGPDPMPAALELLSARTDPSIRLGVMPSASGEDRATTPTALVETLAPWLTAFPRLQLLGTCCGTDPDWTGAISRMVQVHTATMPP